MAKILNPLSPEILDLRRIVGDAENLHAKVDAVKTVTDNLPVNTSSELDAIDSALATIDTVVDGIQTDLSNATDGLGAIKAAVDVVVAATDTVEASLTALDGKIDIIDTNVDDIETLLGTVNTKVDTLDTVADSVKLDTAANKATLENATYGLAALDTKIGTVDTVVDTIAADLVTVDAIVDEIKSIALGIQNATLFTAAVPTLMEVPESGTRYYRITTRLYDSSHLPVDSIDDEIFFRAVDPSGNIVSGIYFSNNTGTAITAEVSGDYTGWYALDTTPIGQGTAFLGIASTATKQHLTIEFGYKVNVNSTPTAYSQTRSTQVVDYESTATTAGAVWNELKSAHEDAGSFGLSIATIETNVAANKATLENGSYGLQPISSKIDDIDSAVYNIQTDLDNATDGLGAIKAAVDANQADLTAIEGKLDILDTVADGIQTDLSNATDGLGAIKAAVDANQADLTSIEGKLDTVDANVDQALLDIATVDAVVDSIKLDTAANKTTLESGTFGLAAIKTQTAAVEADTQDIQSKIGTIADLNSGGATIGDNLEEIYGKVANLASNSTSFKVTGTTGTLNSGGTAAETLEIALASPNVKILNLKISASAVSIADFDMQIFEKTGNPAADLVFEIVELNEVGANLAINLIYRNNDTTPLSKLYVKFINQSATDSTFTVVARGEVNAA